MTEFLTMLLIVFVVFGISFLLINIRYIIKGEEFRGTCASNNPMLKDNFVSCSVCGREPGEECADPALSNGKVFAHSLLHLYSTILFQIYRLIMHCPEHNPHRPSLSPIHP